MLHCIQLDLRVTGSSLGSRVLLCDAHMTSPRCSVEMFYHSGRRGAILEREATLCFLTIDYWIVDLPLPCSQLNLSQESHAGVGKNQSSVSCPWKNLSPWKRVHKVLAT